MKLVRTVTAKVNHHPTDQTYAFVDKFLEEAMKISCIYETDADVDYEYW
jgi:hypothetical protein